MKKWLLVIAWGLLLSSGPTLFADELNGPQASSATISGVQVSTETEPFVWPVSSIIAGHHVKVVSKFGKRLAPDTKLPEMHEGIDFAVPAESNVRAARSGKVRFVGFSSAYVSRKDKTDKNHLVIILHADGKSTRYVHLNILRVRPGQDVKSGDLLGTSSDSDEWMESVVHFEIRDAQGKALDPMIWLVAPASKTPR